MTSSILLEGLQVVESHRLLVEDSDEELQRVVIFQPGHVVCRHSEGECVRLWEHVLTVEFLEDFVCDILRHSPLSGFVSELLPELGEECLVVATSEGSTQLVGLQRVESRHFHRHLIHLILVQNDAQGALQSLALQRMVEAPGLALTTSDELSHAIVGPNTGTHCGDFVGHIGQVDGLYSGDGLHLGRRLHLKYTHGVSLVQGVVYRRVLEVHAAEVNVVSSALLDKLESVLHLGERAQGQKVDLHESGVAYGILVPVADETVVDGRLLNRHNLAERG